VHTNGTKVQVWFFFLVTKLMVVKTQCISRVDKNHLFLKKSQKSDFSLFKSGLPDFNDFFELMCRPQGWPSTLLIVKNLFQYNFLCLGFRSTATRNS